MSLITLTTYPVEPVLKILLQDKTTKKNITFASKLYEEQGRNFSEDSEITLERLAYIDLLPRVEKEKVHQQNRTKQRAEVFTPSWVCNKMLNYIDKEWFGSPDVFNKENGTTWIPGKAPITFPKGKNWKSYVDSPRIEITCGEAPYLVSRYDTTTGKALQLCSRIGILDRKLRVIGENTITKEEWLKWAYRAFQSSYGYEYQGDSLLIARINLLITFADYMEAAQGKKPSEAELKKVANIIAWNIWQMDGLTGTVPYGTRNAKHQQLTLFNFEAVNEGREVEQEAIPCRIHNWRSKESFEYNDLKRSNTMARKFTFCVGNPPYQETRETTKDMPVYNFFMDAAYTIADKSELITPSRFLFNAGATSASWNKKMLNDTHFKVLSYEPESSKVFPSTDIKGGVAIHYYDHDKQFGAIGTFTSYNEVNSIRSKVLSSPGFQSLNTIMYPYSTYTLAEAFWEDFPDKKAEVEYIAKHRNELSREEKRGKLSNLRILTTNIFDLLPEVFLDEKPETGEYVCIIGRQGNKRRTKYIKKEYIDVGENYSKWKVIIPKSNGSGSIGEVLSTPLIGTPFIGYTQTYLGIGALDSEDEANALYKYVCSKFARVCLGILKITQDNPPEKWAYVPLQNFTSDSDIDWSKSIREIDQQLYQKYGLTDEEIEFIETHVKEMK